MQLGTDLIFRCPTVAVARQATKAGVPVWQYEFDHARAGSPVSHGSEIGLIFGKPQPGAPPLQDYWSNFVQRGSSNRKGLAYWPRFDAKTRRYLAFGQRATVVRARLRDVVCEGRETP